MQTGCGVRGGVAGGAAGGGELFRRGVRRSPPCVRSCAISFVFWVCRAVAHTPASGGQKHVARLVVLLVGVGSFAACGDPPKHRLADPPIRGSAHPPIHISIDRFISAYPPIRQPTAHRSGDLAIHRSRDHAPKLERQSHAYIGRDVRGGGGGAGRGEFFSLWGVVFSAACPGEGDMTGGGRMR